MTSLAKAARKLKRTGKSAAQFKFTSTFEYIELSCNGFWRPEKLKVIWLRNHRRVESIGIPWVVSEDRGPNGADGKATFNPTIAVSLIVTLYRAPKKTSFEEKEYKFYIESDGPGGKKIVASFTCDMAEYAAVPNSSEALDMTFKCVSKKVNKAVLGITVASQFIKEGNSLDDDMQSTFSAMSMGQDSVMDFDDEDGEDDSGEGHRRQSGAAAVNGSHRLSSVKEETEGQAEAESLHEKLSPQPAALKAPDDRPRRKTVESKDVYKAPLNPFLEEEEQQSPSPTTAVSPTEEWLGDSPIIDCFDEAQSRKKLDSADLIGLYFSASWCPPCRRFLPKLIYFYHQLKQHNKSFEVIYLSSDNSKHDMMKYMVEQQMPWVAVDYGSQVAETLKAKFNVKAIPLLTIVSAKGEKIEESAKKAVEGANTASAAVKLYNKWQKLLAPESESESVSDAANVVADGGGDSKEKKGLLHKVKNHIRGKNKSEKGGELSDGDCGDVLSEKSVEGSSEPDKQSEEKKPKAGRTKSSAREQLEEKEERIRHLEAVNITLKQTNDDLNEEVAELRRQLTEQAEKVKTLESTHQRLEDERRTLQAHMNIRGWLFKRGVKGPTANVWRRRYFRCDQGSRICYYKTSAESTPQGFIDLDKVISIQEVSAAQQDKNHATFLVQCDGRTFQLQAHDETTMRKWMNAIEYLRNYRQMGGASAT